MHLFFFSPSLALLAKRQEGWYLSAKTVPAITHQTLDYRVKKGLGIGIANGRLKRSDAFFFNIPSLMELANSQVPGMRTLDTARSDQHLNSQMSVSRE